MGCANSKPGICQILFFSLSQNVNIGSNTAIPLVNSIFISTVATHTKRMFFQTEENIKQDHLGKQGSLAFNQDAWKAPNVTSMMAATAPHYIDEHFILQDLTITVPHVTGKSLGPLNQ
ncbi:uncharacterized protein VP01_4782g1 [Puccinia sorghi]|uniref:Uncharacterized protein n=1 Tax=Puccinia sorghi TaxID=27349 RepID=A0A0L6UNF5_9BASI|nr:uncharacterized protein VP01_4782g1 [Puccinia sorghi]